MTIIIERHRTAIKRGDLSRPLRLLLGAGILNPIATFFDYGCGRGEDVDFLNQRGFKASGWDPFYAPENAKNSADFVAITYVINVIESIDERTRALQEAFVLSKRALLVSAQITLAQTGAIQVPYADGILTGTGTFQKYFTQSELKGFVEEVIGKIAYPVGLGVFIVFKDETLLDTFESHRFHSRIEPRKLEITDELQKELQTSLDPLIAFFHKRGRFLRGTAEREPFTKELKSLGGMKRAERFVNTLIGADGEAIQERREEDLLLFLAMARFQRRNLKMSTLSIHIQNDLKVFFGSLKKANEIAEFLLFGLGEDGTIAHACRTATFGKLLPDALYVHTDYIDRLPLMLRLVEGLASRYLGRVDGATLVKFSLKAPTVSYLFYPDFDTEAHPALQQSIRAELGRLETKFTDYTQRSNPPILHRKELFIPSDDERHAGFAKLTRLEETAGLYTDPNSIGTRDGWNAALASKGL